MANKELPALPSVGALAGAQVLYLVDENNNSRKVALSDLAQWIKTAASIVPSSNPWRGARVRRTVNLSLASAATGAVTWQSAALDTGSFWSAGAPTRLVVPAGVTKVRLRGSARFAANSSGQRQIFITKNGAPLEGRFSVLGNAVATPNTTDLNGTSGVIAVAAGDYFEMSAYQNTSAALDLLAHETTWFELEVVEGM